MSGINDADFWARAVTATDDYMALTKEVLQRLRSERPQDADVPALRSTEEGLTSLLSALDVLRGAYNAVLTVPGMDERFSKPGYSRYGRGSAPPRGNSRPQ